MKHLYDYNNQISELPGVFSKKFRPVRRAGVVNNLC